MITFDAVKPESRSRFAFERELSQTGVTCIAGVDEAGCGPLAGPVTAAAVIFPPEWFQRGVPYELRGINDSKQLTPETRDQFYDKLTARQDVCFAIATVDSALVDELNILEAAHRAMDDALAQLNPSPQHVLIDGRRVKTLRFPQTAIIKGDARSYSIAAASVLAKVTRDRIMVAYDRDYPAYGFADHKGYSTARHLAALVEHGPCPIHRRSFAPVREPFLFHLLPCAAKALSPRLQL